MSAEVDEVRAANERFYNAHESRDLAAMSALWRADDSACCIHPGWPILRGWSLVEQSWAQIFAGSSRNQFIITNDSVTVEGDVAWVVADENLMDGAATGTIAATNIYVKTLEGWLLTLHHGSPVAAR